MTEALSLTNCNQAYLADDINSGLFNDRREILAVNPFNEGILYDLTGEITKASESFSKTIALNEENLQLIPMAISHLAHLQELQGLVRDAEETYLVAMRIIDEHPDPLPLSGLADIGLGNIFCERNQLDQAEVHLRKGIELGHMWGFGGVLSSGYIGLARVAMAKGRVTEANQLLEEAVEIVGSLHDAWQTPIIESSQAMLWARQGEIENALRWSQSNEIDAGQPIPFNQEILAITLARVWIAMGEYDQAQDLIGILIKSNESRQAWGQIIQLQIFNALAAHSHGNFDSAFDSLENALKLADKENYQRIFLEEGEEMRSILKGTNERLSGEHDDPLKRYIKHLLKAFEGEPPYSVGTDHQKLPVLEPLSERELEVIILLEEGLSNQEIAARLYISSNTVKAHLKSIYGKLGG